MSQNETVSLKGLSTILLIGGGGALGLVGLVWLLLHVFVL